MQTIIDTHCHLAHKIFTGRLEQILTKAERAGVRHCIIPAVLCSDWEKILQLCHTERRCSPALGLHPLFLREERVEKELAMLAEYLQKYSAKREIAAIGEVGLDFYNGRKTEPLQRKAFTAQIRLAKKYNLPLLLHIRKAHDEALSLLRQENFASCGRGGIVHAYSGSMQQAEHYIKMGFLFGIGGSITYPRAKKLRLIAKELPRQSIVLETDSPDMPPLGCLRGANTPARLAEIAAVLAELRGESRGETAGYTTSNAVRLFQLPQYSS